MTRLTRIIDEYLSHKPSVESLADSVLETALYLEDSLGIRITDTEMTAAELGSRDAILRLVARKGRGGS